MELHNNMEELVIRYVESIQKKVKDVCSCEKCRVDIAAVALNNLPPRYVVTHKGDVYTRLNEMETQYIADVVSEVTKAIEIVSKNPRHD